MNYIAHRGNMTGANPADENKPEYLKATLDRGYDVEADIWLMPEGLYLGHDAPTYKTDRQFLQNRRVWTHCKNAAAIVELSKFHDINCFAHDKDEIVVTSRGFLWANTYCKTWDYRTVVVSLGPEWTHPGRPPYGICTDCPTLFAKMTLAEKLPFLVLICDIDGVMTNGKMYDLDGKVIGKQYCDLDFTAIKRFMAAGIKVCFLSGDLKVNEAMAKTRKIDFFHNQPGTDKVDVLPQIRECYGTDRLAYVGDDYYDIQIMRSIDYAFCPRSSPVPVRRAAKFIVPVDAGMGVIAGVYDIVESAIPHAFPRDSADVNPK